MAVQVWRKMDGRPHVPLLRALNDALAWHVLTRPGVSEEALRELFPLLSPLELRTALLALIATGQVDEVRMPPAALPASPFAPPTAERGVAEAGGLPPRERRAYIAARGAQLPFLGISSRSCGEDVVMVTTMR